MNTKKRRKKTRHDIIAMRRLRDEDKHKNFVVWIGRPRKSGPNWECPFHIDFPPEVEAGYGGDAFQALVNAIESIRIRLEQRRRPFTWRGGEFGETGFPRYVPPFLGREFARSISRLIDIELLRFAEKGGAKTSGSDEPKAAARKRSVTQKKSR